MELLTNKVYLVPFLAIAFGFCTMFMAFAQNYAAFIAIRTLLGCFEAGQSNVASDLQMELKRPHAQ